MYEFVPLIKGLFISIGNVTSEPTIDFQWTCLCLVVNSEIIFRFISPNVQGKKSPKIHHLPGKIEKNTNPDLPQRTRRNHYYLLGWGRVLDEITNILGPWLAWTHTHSLSLYIYIYSMYPNGFMIIYDHKEGTCNASFDDFSMMSWS